MFVPFYVEILINTLKQVKLGTTTSYTYFERNKHPDVENSTRHYIFIVSQRLSDPDVFKVLCLTICIWIRRKWIRRIDLGFDFTRFNTTIFLSFCSALFWLPLVKLFFGNTYIIFPYSKNKMYWYLNYFKLAV